MMSALRAHYDGRHFIPDEPVDLPKGTPVTITLVSTDVESPLLELAELARRHPILDSPPDWSENHDNYIHGSLHP